MQLVAAVARVIKFERPLCFYGAMKTHLGHKVTYQKFCREFFPTVGCKWAGWGSASGHRAVCVCFCGPAVWLSGSLPRWLVSAGRSDRQTMMTAVIRGCSSLPPIHPRTQKKSGERSRCSKTENKGGGGVGAGGGLREANREVSLNPAHSGAQLGEH